MKHSKFFQRKKTKRCRIFTEQCLVFIQSYGTSQVSFKRSLVIQNISHNKTVRNYRAASFNDNHLIKRRNKYKCSGSRAFKSQRGMVGLSVITAGLNQELLHHYQHAKNQLNSKIHSWHIAYFRDPWTMKSYAHLWAQPPKISIQFQENIWKVGQMDRQTQFEKNLLATVRGWGGHRPKLVNVTWALLLAVTGHKINILHVTIDCDSPNSGGQATFNGGQRITVLMWSVRFSKDLSALDF